MHRLAVFRALTGAAAVLTLAGCSSLQSADNFLGVVTPYRVEIVQGNVLTQEQVDQVKPGMSKAQVRNVLGSPLLTDMFHADRWDYIFTIKRQGAQPQRRSVVVLFDGDVLKSIDAPALPTEREFVAAISTVKPSGRPAVLELTEEQRKALPAPAPLTPEPALPAGPLREYPPLEAR
jgi:outer membrane protein assembly factor BamE